MRTVALRRGPRPDRSLALSCLLSLVPLVVLLAPGPAARQAWAQQASDVADEADVQFRLGNEAYRQQDFRTALAHYFASNRLAANRNVQFNIARCYEQLREFVEAFRYYQICSLAPALPAAEKEGIERALARVRPYVSLLQVSSSPPGATLYVDRRDLGAYGATPRVLALAPGRYRVLLDLPGHEPYVKEGVTLTLGAEVAVRAELRPILGAVRVKGSPAGALVRVQGRTRVVEAALPARFDLFPGRHPATVSHPGYVSKQLTLEVEPQGMAEVEVRLERQTGSLVVQADERDAIILLDGKAVGFTPAVIDNIPSGKHRIEVRLEGFRRYGSEVEVLPDTRVPVVASLTVAEDIEAASRYVEAIQDTPASASLITRRELTTFDYPRLADALVGTRGFYTSNDANYVSVGIRGFSPFGQYGNRLLVQLDGHTLNDEWIGSSFIGFDLLSDLSSLERVEVVRGPGSVLHGTGAFFGVLNLVSPSAAPDYRVRGGFGTVDAGVYRALASGGAPIGKQGGFWIAAAGVYGQPGDYFSPAYVGSTEAPDGWAHGVGGFDGESSLGKLWWRDLTVQYYFNRRHKQIPTAAFDTIFGDPRTRNDDLRAFAEVRYEPPVASWARLLGRAYYDYYGYDGEYAYEDPTQETYAGHSLGLEARALMWPHRTLRLTAGAAYELHFSNRERGIYLSGPGAAKGPYLDERHPYHQIAAYAVANYAPVRWFSAEAGVRFDGRFLTNLRRADGSQSDRFLQSVNPRFAFVFHPVPSGTLKLLSGSAFRAPSVYELSYTDGGITQIPSPDLDPETILSGEIEYSHRLPRGFWLTAGVFLNRISDLIEQVGSADATQPQDKLRYINRTDAVWTLGGEIELRREFRRDWMLAVQYSFQRTRQGSLGSGGSELPNSPAHLAGLKLVAPLVSRYLRLATRLAVESGRLDRNAQQSADGQPPAEPPQRTATAVLWDLTLSGEVQAIGLRYAAGIRNLLDWKYSYPVGDDIKDLTVTQPGRSLLVDVSFAF